METTIEIRTLSGGNCSYERRWLDSMHSYFLLFSLHSVFLDIKSMPAVQTPIKLTISLAWCSSQVFFIRTEVR